jgi:hypothetical protein
MNEENYEAGRSTTIWLRLRRTPGYSELYGAEYNADRHGNYVYHE